MWRNQPRKNANDVLPMATGHLRLFGWTPKSRWIVLFLPYQKSTATHSAHGCEINFAPRNEPMVQTRTFLVNWHVWGELNQTPAFLRCRISSIHSSGAFAGDPYLDPQSTDSFFQPSYHFVMGQRQKKESVHWVQQLLWYSSGLAFVWRGCLIVFKRQLELFWMCLRPWPLKGSREAQAIHILERSALGCLLACLSTLCLLEHREGQLNDGKSLLGFEGTPLMWKRML